MFRQKKQISIAGPIEAVGRLTDCGGRLKPGAFTLHVRGHRVFARWTPLSGFDNTPTFHGHVERRPDGFTVDGTIREMRAAALLPWTFVVLTICGIASLYAGFSGLADAGGAIPFIVGFILTPVFSIATVLGFQRRRPTFRARADDLELGLQTYLHTGLARRRTLI